MWKKVIAVVVLVVLIGTVSVFAAPGYRSDPGPGDILGQGKFQGDPHKIFRLVRYVPNLGDANSATLVVDSIVIWDCVSDDAVTVTTTTTSPDSAVAGILATYALTPDANQCQFSAAQAVGLRNWAWLQTYGKAEVRINTTNPVDTAGQAMGTSAVAGEADIFVPSTTDSGKNGNAGFFYDAGAAAADDVECFVRLD